MESFNIWDLERVNIKLDGEFLKKLNKILISKFKIKREAWKEIFPNKEFTFKMFRNLLKPSLHKIYFVPLDFFIKLVENINISRVELQQNITFYKAARGVNFIKSQILPILISPIFHMFFAHNLGDGGVINPKKGRLPYFGYRQFDEFYRLAYIRKIEAIFGKIDYKEDYLLKSTMVYCPPVVSTLFFKYYNFKIEDFLSDRARIPKFILNSNKDNLLAILLAFIIDEGNIDSTQITIHLNNQGLIEDLGEICSILNYKFTKTSGDLKTNFWRLNILRVGMKKLYEDYILLNKKYSIIDLGKKGKKIEDSFKINERKIYKAKGNRDSILHILKREQLSVNQLAERINMTRQGVRFHIHNLLKQEKIKLLNNKELNWIYGV
jgi:hypothetical protein